MSELEIAPSTIEVGEKAAVELDPFELRRRSRRKQDFTKAVGAIASGNPEAALEYEAEYGLEDDYAEDQEAIQTFVALQQAANGDTNAAVSLFDDDSQLFDSISRINSNPINTTPEEAFSYTPSQVEAYSTDFSKLSRQRLALGGLPGTAPVDSLYLNFLRNNPQTEPLSPAATAGIGESNVQSFNTRSFVGSDATQAGTASYIDFAEEAATTQQGTPGRTAAGDTLAGIAPDLAMAGLRGNIDPQATALSQARVAGPNTNTAVNIYSNLGAASRAINNPNLNLLDPSTLAALGNLGLNAANTLSRLNSFDITAIPNEVTNFFDRIGNFIEEFAANPVETINSATNTLGNFIAYGPDIQNPVSVKGNVFDAKTLEVSTNPGYLTILTSLVPGPMGFVQRASNLYSNRGINQLSDFSKAASYDAWDSVTASTVGQLSVPNEARDLGVTSLGVGFSGLMNANINGVSLTFDPFAEQPMNSLSPIDMFLDVDPEVANEQRANIDIAVTGLSQAVQTDPELAQSYASTLSDNMNIGFDSTNTLSISQLGLEDEFDKSFIDETDMAFADYGAATKEALDKADAAFAAGKLSATEYAQAVNNAALSSGAKNAQIAVGIARGSIAKLAQPVFGSYGYYAAQAEKNYNYALELDLQGLGGTNVPGSFAAVGEAILDDYNKPNPSNHTIDIFDRLGMTRSANQNPELVGRVSLDSSRDPDFAMQEQLAFEMEEARDAVTGTDAAASAEAAESFGFGDPEGDDIW